MVQSYQIPTIHLQIRRSSDSEGRYEFIVTHPTRNISPIIQDVLTSGIGKRAWDHLKGADDAWQTSYRSTWNTAQNRVALLSPDTDQPDDESSNDAGITKAENALVPAFHAWLNQPQLDLIWNAIREIRREIGPDLLTPVEVLVFCDCPPRDIVHHLPWRTFKIEEGIYLGRTVENRFTSQQTSGDQTLERRGSIRVLQVIAHSKDEPEASKFLKHENLVNRLAQAGGVKVTTLTSKECGTPEALRQQFLEKLKEGPDIVVFSGHGAQEFLTGGCIYFGAQEKMHFHRYQEEFKAAIANGWKVAILISCNTYHFAHSLIDLGLSHAIAMKHIIHVDAATHFLDHLCHHLRHHCPLHEAMNRACAHLENKRADHPSAYLVPAQFRHPEALPFQLERSFLERQRQKWQPTRRESAIVATIAVLSLIAPLQNRLFNGRTAMQAISQDIGSRVGLHQPANPLSPPVLLVSIDQDSLNAAAAEFPSLTTNPIDRRYLAALINQLTQAQAKVIGVDYLLNEPVSEQDRQLRLALSDSIKKQTWLVFAQSSIRSLGAHSKLANPNQTLQGNTDFQPWQVELPDQDPLNVQYKNPPDSKSTLPFAYLLTLVQQMTQQEANKLTPSSSSSSPLQLRLPIQLNKLPKDADSGQPLQAILHDRQSSFWLQNLLDFSLSPDQVYTKVKAKDLAEKLDDQEFRAGIKNQIVIIIPGGYDLQDKEDKESFPAAMRYWCSFRGVVGLGQKQSQCQMSSDDKIFPLGIVHAYMVYQIKNRHFIWALHPILFILLAVGVSKEIYSQLDQSSPEKRDRWLNNLPIGYLAYVLGSLQLYSLCGLAIPIIFPSVVVGLTLWPWISQIQNQRRLRYATSD